MGVGGAHRVEPAEGRDQHEQRRARQVEVGHQHIDGLEAVAGRDEDRRSRRRRARSCHRRPRRFPAAAATWCRRRRCGRRAARAAFSAAAVSAATSPHSACMRCSSVSSAFTGRKVPAPDVQRHEMARDAARVERRQQLGREMQAGGRRGDRAVLAGIDGLIALGSRSSTRACRRCRAAAASPERLRSPRRDRRRAG